MKKKLISILLIGTLSIIGGASINTTMQNNKINSQTNNVILLAKPQVEQSSNIFEEAWNWVDSFFTDGHKTLKESDKIVTNNSNGLSDKKIKSNTKMIKESEIQSQFDYSKSNKGSKFNGIRVSISNAILAYIYPEYGVKDTVTIRTKILKNIENLPDSKLKEWSHDLKYSYVTIAPQGPYGKVYKNRHEINLSIGGNGGTQMLFAFSNKPGETFVGVKQIANGTK